METLMNRKQHDYHLKFYSIKLTEIIQHDKTQIHKTFKKEDRTEHCKYERIPVGNSSNICTCSYAFCCLEESINEWSTNQDEVN